MFDAHIGGSQESLKSRKTRELRAMVQLPRPVHFLVVLLRHISSKKHRGLSAAQKVSCRLNRVCKEWRQMIEHHPECWSRISLATERFVSSMTLLWAARAAGPALRTRKFVWPLPLV